MRADAPRHSAAVALADRDRFDRVCLKPVAVSAASATVLARARTSGRASTGSDGRSPIVIRTFVGDGRQAAGRDAGLAELDTLVMHESGGSRRARRGASSGLPSSTERNSIGCSAQMRVRASTVARGAVPTTETGSARAGTAVRTLERIRRDAARSALRSLHQIKRRSRLVARIAPMKNAARLSLTGRKSVRSHRHDVVNREDGSFRPEPSSDRSLLPTPLHLGVVARGGEIQFPIGKRRKPSTKRRRRTGPISIAGRTAPRFGAGRNLLC